MFRNALRLGAAVLMAGVSASAVLAQDTQSPDLMVVFDASGSMWGQIDGVPKIEVAREVFADISQDWADSGQAVGLIAYGHRRKGDCEDIELLERPSVSAVQSLADRVQGLVPRGKTPLSQAVRLAAEELRFTENAATVVLLSDGVETCNLDPCAVGTELERLGVDFTAHVIGFDIQSETDRAQLQCLAENTGGQYMDARDAGSLTDALNSVTAASAEPAGVLPVRVLLQIAEGSTRPAFVTLKATELDTGEVVNLGRLDGADQVINGAVFDLAEGSWRVRAEGDAGAGSVDVTVAPGLETVFVPFTGAAGSFALVGATQFATDDTITVQIQSLEQLQSGATYAVMLFPGGATQYDQNVTYSYRFGSDDEVTDHNFYLWEYDLPAGDYDIIVMPSDTYDLSEHLGRFPITLTEPGAELVDITLQAQFADGRAISGPVSWSLIPDGANGDLVQSSNDGTALFEGLEPGTYDVSVRHDTANGPATGEAQITVSDGSTQFTVTLNVPVEPVTMDQLQEPLTPGAPDALGLNGGFGADAQVAFIGLDGQATVTVPAAPLLSIPSDLATGTYRVHLLHASGEDVFLDTLDVLPVSAQDIGDHGDAGGEEADTMISEEELAAESGQQTPPFEIWERCDGSEPCRVRDRRVDLEWALPPRWAASEPFYYTTAGGAVAENPTVEMARLDGGAFLVVLNPRQWDAQLGPCEDIARGQLCRDETGVALDLQDYDFIKRGLEGDLPKPEGWLPLGRSWTIVEGAMDTPYGLLNIDEPSERAETTTGHISITSELLLGVSNAEPVLVSFELIWDDTGRVTDLFGRFDIEDVAYDIRLARPADWDGTLNTWRGELSQSDSFLSLPITVF